MMMTFFWLISAASAAYAMKPIAKITSYKGKVVLLSGTEIKKIEVGRQLNHDDWIQTEKGEVEIIFNDGAKLRVREYSSVVIRERMEQPDKGSKTKRIVRRISCFVGAIIFKIGKKKKNNYLQAPLSLAGVRGTQLGVGTPDQVTIDWEAGPPGDISGKIKVGRVPRPGKGNWSAHPCVQALLKALKIPTLENIIGAKTVAYKTLLGNKYISGDEQGNLQQTLENLNSVSSAPPYVNISHLDRDRTHKRIDDVNGYLRVIKKNIQALMESMADHSEDPADYDEIQRELNEQYIIQNSLTDQLNQLEIHTIELNTINACFSGETLILTGEGALKRIKDVRVGDTVMAYDIGRDKRVPKKVLKKSENHVEYCFLINASLRAASGERFLTTEGWKRVDYLKKGDQLLYGMESRTVDSIEKIPGRLKVYNLNVEDSHTFFVISGKNTEFIVHNEGPGGGK
jgi:hypothetical protein